MRCESRSTLWNANRALRNSCHPPLKNDASHAVMANMRMSQRISRQVAGVIGTLRSGEDSRQRDRSFISDFTPYYRRLHRSEIHKPEPKQLPIDRTGHECRTVEEIPFFDISGRSSSDAALATISILVVWRVAVVVECMPST